MNKALLSDINLEAPMFIALTQTFITAAICFIKKTLSHLWPDKVYFPETSVFGKETIKHVSSLHLHIFKVLTGLF